MNPITDYLLAAACHPNSLCSTRNQARSLPRLTFRAVPMIGHKSPRLNLSHKHCGLGTILWFVLVPLLVFASAETGRAQNLLKTIADVPLPGGTTRFDYQSLDPSTGYLYLSHMGDGTVV